jgi:2-polyprenyl-3-methyl-5-hydroxy-6-metoxy-1,4-benzoquinol methylase
MTLTSVPCAVCGGIDFALIYPATISDPEADPALYYSSSRALAGYLDIVRCRRCGLLMTNPRDDDATLARVYAALEDATYDVEDDNRLRTARAFLAWVERYQPQRGRLLDAGCASGMFVAAADQAGWHVTGLEVSRWAIARAQERCPRATFVTGLLEDQHFAPASFDAITLWDVLEHVHSPREVISRLNEWLAPQGWLFLNVPDADSRAARLMGRRWVLLLREHLWYFSRETLAALLAQQGFEVVHARANWVHFSLTNVLVRLSQYPGWLGRVAQRLASQSWLRRIVVRFPMGEITIAARRTAGSEPADRLEAAAENNRATSSTRSSGT